MRKLNLKKIITMGLITTSILAVTSIGASAEWRQDGTGYWYSNGNSYAKGWSKINGRWYYFDNTGYMKTGWLYDNGNWYYLNKDGSMVASLYTQVPIEGSYSIFAPDGKWMGYYKDKNNNIVSTANMDTVNQQISTIKAKYNDFTNEEAVEYAKLYGNHSYNGNFKSNIFEDKIRTNVNGKYKLLVKHSDPEGVYDGLLVVYENGNVVDYMAGAYTNELMDPSYKYTDKTFDETKLGYVKPTADPSYDNRYYEMK